MAQNSDYENLFLHSKKRVFFLSIFLHKLPAVPHKIARRKKSRRQEEMSRGEDKR